MRLASLWAGLEAILGVRNEIQFRISARTAAFLESAGRDRLELFRETLKLYKFRSKAVHVEDLDDSVIESKIDGSRVILSRLISKILEEEGMPSEEDWEGVLFS